MGSPADDFRQARHQASIQTVLARLTGRSAQLISFEDVRQKLQLHSRSHRGQREIPVAAIVGSVGRYNDFTRSFFPRNNSDLDRWTNVKTAMTQMKNLPPIEVYQIDQVYFVLDGNHRVSVARHLGITHLEAFITEFKTEVPFNPDDQPDDLIVKAEYVEFLRTTHFTRVRPEADLRVTVPGQYWQLETHLEAHRYLQSQAEGRELSAEEAIGHWYDHVYLPVIELIREQAILRDFPDRTETDLFLWIFNHRATLEKQLGWRIQPEAAVSHLVSEYSPRRDRVLARVNEKLFGVVTPAQLEAGPPPGQWRQQRGVARTQESLFTDILVPLGGDPGGWQALELALTIAQAEEGRILGLHVVGSAAQKKEPAVQALAAEFERRCQRAGIAANLVIEAGQILPQLCERARWVDLVVMYPANPPGSKMMTRLSSGSRSVIYRSPRPVLTVPGPAVAPRQLLLAYNGSPKAQEALFVAAYLVDHWDAALTVLAVLEADSSPDPLAEARRYLAPRPATFLTAESDVPASLLATAAEQDCDLILMGGYSAPPWREVVRGSTVDDILQQSRYPILICR